MMEIPTLIIVLLVGIVAMLLIALQITLTHRIYDRTEADRLRRRVRKLEDQPNPAPATDGDRMT